MAVRLVSTPTGYSVSPERWPKSSAGTLMTEIEIRIRVSVSGHLCVVGEHVGGGRA